MGIFTDNPPIDLKRSTNKGWLKPKPSASKKQVLALKEENLNLKTRLEQLESVVEGLASKKKK